MSKKKYIGVNLLENVQPMSLDEAKKKGYVIPEAEGEADGYEFDQAGFVSWMPKTSFESLYAPVTEGQLKNLGNLEVLDLPTCVVTVAAVKVNVSKITDKEWSLSRFAVETLSIFGVKI